MYRLRGRPGREDAVAVPDNTAPRAPSQMTPTRRGAIHAAIVRFADGERDAFRAVFRGLWPVLVTFARGRDLGAIDAEDAAQRALLKLLERIGKLDRGRDGVRWAVNLTAFEVVASRKQSSQRREVPAEALHDLSGAPAAEEDVIAADLRKAVRAAIERLEETDRAALAQVLGDAGFVGGRAARRRRHRAMARLRIAWSRIHG